MDNNDFKDFMEQAREISEQLAAVFKDVTGEDLDVETAVRHYPVVSLGLAAGVGLLGGWWMASKRRRASPPPEIPERGRAFIEGIDRIFPGGIESLRRAVPGLPAEETGALLGNWMDQVLEPRIKQGLQNLTVSFSEGKLGAYFKESFEGRDTPLDDSAP